MTYGVIMAGGKGTRLWPEGRQSRPKQLLALTDERPMIRIAVERLAPLIPPSRQLIVTTAEYAPQIAAALPGFPHENILAEPEGRDTAPCIGWAALKVMQRNPVGVMAVVAADHVVADERAFRQALYGAIQLAMQERIIVTIGLVPTRPDTGYGYIRFSHELREIEGIEVFRVARFVEKPNLERAKQYVEDGRYLWNSGMFIMQASYALELFSKHLPRHRELLRLIEKSLGTPDEGRVTAETYGRFERISIDYGIMEHAENVAVIRGDFGWLDIGTWPSLDLVRQHDAHGNVVNGPHVSIDTERCIIRSSGSLIATLAVHDLVIIETPDAVLVCPKNQAQRVREMVRKLEEMGREDKA